MHKISERTVKMIADKIKKLREKAGITQAELARQLGITRSGVNSWEMGITVPSTMYIVELALFFGVSTDYLLDMPETKTISVNGLTDREIASITEIVECYNPKRHASNIEHKKARFKNIPDISEPSEDKEK